MRKKEASSGFKVNRFLKCSSSGLLRISLIANIVLLIGGLMRISLTRVCNLSSSSFSINPFTPDETSHPTTVTAAVPLQPFAPIVQYNISTVSKQPLVPNIVHYIWYNTEQKSLKFHHMLCILSAYKLLQPDVIYFHTNLEPIGPYWKRVVQLPKFKINYRQPPTTLFGEKVKDPAYYTSHSNVDRVKVLMEYGGIYLDLDVLVTRPFDELRRYPCTIGREQETKSCGSVIICAKDSPFLLLWINSYLDDYQVNEWAYNTGQVPFNLARRYPHLVNLDENRINRPNFKELDVIWGSTRFNWQNNYAVHLWYRLWKDMSPYYAGIEPNDDNVKTWNSTFGEMARTILYGNKAMMHAD